MSIGISAGAAALIGGGLAAAGGVGSALIGKSAASKASQQQTQAAQAGIDQEQKQYDTTAKNLAPWMTGGLGSFSQLTQGTQPGGSLVTPFGETYTQPAPFSYAAFNAPAPFTAPTGVDESNDPGYQFRLQQGQQALTRGQAAGGGAFSGGTLQALTRYGQDYASNEYQNVYNRALTGYNTNFADKLNSYSTNLAGALNTYNTNVNTGLEGYNTRANAYNTGQTNQFNRLALLAGMGQGATNTLAGAGQANSLAIANLLGDKGNAAAAGTLGQGGALSSGLNSVFSGLSGGLLGSSLISLLTGGSNKNPDANLPPWVGAPLPYQP
jgi:hypothetical protein